MPVPPDVDVVISEVDTQLRDPMELLGRVPPGLHPDDVRDWIMVLNRWYTDLVADFNDARHAGAGQLRRPKKIAEIKLFVELLTRIMLEISDTAVPDELAARYRLDGPDDVRRFSTDLGNVAAFVSRDVVTPETKRLPELRIDTRDPERPYVEFNGKSYLLDNENARRFLMLLLSRNGAFVAVTRELNIAKPGRDAHEKLPRELRDLFDFKKGSGWRAKVEEFRYRQ